ncbi:hypothetical protein [Ohtaekwangia sp.]|uniref:hypothetical protein n=1 Tax=Ohtaekwangia sp. TaxID=2066019 RepID=UPI002F92A9E0
MQVYFEKEYATISYDNTTHAITIDWKVRPFSSEFRTGLESLLKAMEHFKTGKVIADTRNLGTLAIEDQDWSANDWTAMALEAGYYSDIAIIVPSDVYDKMAIDDVMARVEGSSLKVGYFDERESAAAWIKQLEVANN